MKVLHFNQFGNYEGGVEAYIAEVSKALAAAGHESHLLYFRGPEVDSLDTGKTRISDEDQLSEINLLSAVANVIRQFDPDAAFIHALYEPELTRTISGMIPSVAYVHGPYVVCPGNAQYLPRSQRPCPRRASLQCVVSAKIEGCMFGRNPLTHLKRLSTVKSFVEVYQKMRILVGSIYMRDLLTRSQIPRQMISILPPLLTNRERIKAYSQPSDTNQILFAGRLVREKGLPQLIRSLAPLDNDWKLVVAGDGESRSEIEQLAQELEVDAKVKFLGWQSQAQMSDLYRSSALVIVPSLWPEPFGRIGAEAFLHGRPVIAFDVGGVGDWLDDGQTGFLVPAGDLNLLRDRIMLLLDSPELQSRMGQQALIKAQTTWLEDEHVQTLIQIFEQAIEEINII